MSGSRNIFTGRFDYKLDSKNRVAVPPEWRPNSGEMLYMRPIKREGLPGLAVLTEERLLELEEQINNYPDEDIAKKNRRREWLYSSLVSVSVNAQGKLCIPKKFCEFAKLDSNVSITANKNQFSIWNTSTLESIEELEYPDREQMEIDMGI